MKKVLFLVGASAVVALMSFGCGSSSSSGSGGSSTATSTTSTSSKATTGSNTTTSTGGSSSTGAGAASSTSSSMGPSCMAYCTEVTTNCTGTNEQYPTIAPATAMDSCMGVCAGFPVGTSADMTGDSLGCREYHGGAPAMGDPVTHCPHAGPLGGPGMCSTMDPCDAFCEIAQAVCTGANSQWDSVAACKTDCATFTVPMTNGMPTPYTDGDTGKNDLYCRMYHLSAAASSTDNAAVHCGHIIKNSPVCIH